MANNFFVALEPESLLNNLILDKKNTIYEKIGPQKYLSHPPHLTLFCLTSSNVNGLLNNLERISKETKKIKINLKGTHVFYNDPQTGGNTITYSFLEGNCKELRNLQLKIIEHISLYNEKNFIDKDSSIYKGLSKIERNNVDKSGFPFIGENWIPHLTLASIEKRFFHEAFEVISREPVYGPYNLVSLNLYRIGKEPALLKRFNLK